MAKISKGRLNKYLKFLNTYKHLVGFSDWEIHIGVKTEDMGTSLATVCPEILEKRLNLVLSNAFLEQSKKEQANTLIHELLHGRICAQREYVDEYLRISEEHLVNDIIRGYESLIKLDKSL